jgi:hypothetical protein
LTSLAASGCAANVVHNAPFEDLPHVGWEMSADVTPSDSRLVCASGRGDERCALEASTPDRQQLASFTLQLHGAAQTVAYIGTLRASFLAGEPRLHDIQDIAVPGRSLKQVTVVDSVTSVPGDYEVEVELLASMGQTTRPIRFSIPVSVK